MFQITLKMARLNSGLSLDQAAEVAGVTKKTMKRWEQNSGKANLASINRLLCAYGLSIDHVSFGKEEEVIERLKTKLKEVIE
ncbi:helix-turn-helix domain-containing protein [Paenibacillus sp. FSL K6-1230]|uniref:helix-turn-helix domain-containing protein n=1 Tax=Paenibacillus sp. FSL K6-1230 TaxID=2921603 RepID=UPI0030F72D38